MSELKDANANPWYVLMTLYGEQEGERVDRALAEKNRKGWNAWSCQGLSDEVRAWVCASSRVDVAETQGWAEMETEVRELHSKEMARRNGGVSTYLDLPDYTKKIDISGTTFAKMVVLEKTVITQYLYFDWLTSFAHKVRFQSTTFMQIADFGSVTFMQDVDFKRATFMQEAVFNFTVFKHDASFKSAVFTQRAHFQTVAFALNADFEQATFKQDVDFRFATFGGPTNFKSSTFTQPTSFKSATFCEPVDFLSATFNHDAIFKSVTFKNYSVFECTKFMKTADFEFATFTQYAEFESATFEGPAKFIETQFGVCGGNLNCVPNFTEATFAKLVSFRKADFVTHYPVLEGTAFMAKVVVTANNAFWPPMDQVLLGEVDIGAKHISTKEVAKESCSTLRHEIGRQGLPEEEHFFFRREMGFAGQIGGFWQRLPYRLFGAFSDYGQSIARPIEWLCGIFGLGMGMFAAVLRGGSGVVSAIGEGAALSFSNLLPLFGFGRLYFDGEYMAQLPTVLQVWSGAQTVLALPLLFFLGLGLRKRFRLR